MRVEDLADRIRRARRIKGWSQTRLAEGLGVTPGAVGHWERPGGNQPSSEHLVEIAKQLSVHHEWLAVGRGEMLPRDSKLFQPGVISLSDEEQMLVEHYQALPPPSRVLLLQFLDALAASPKSFQDHERPGN